MKDQALSPHGIGAADKRIASWPLISIACLSPKAWASDPIQGTREKAAEELVQTKLDSDFYRFARLKELFPKRETKGIEKIEGGDAYAVVMTAGDVSQTYYFDQKTNLLVRVDQIAVTTGAKFRYRPFCRTIENLKEF